MTRLYQYLALPISTTIGGTGNTTGTATAVPVGGITGLGTGVGTALAVNVGSAGAPVVNGGALGTPSSGNGSNITNVDAATLGGATFAAPGAIGDGTPGPSSFTQTTYPAFSGNSGTASSDTLVGYEQGTWTPSLTNWTNVGSPTLTGTYTRIGRLVFLTFQVVPATSISTTVASSYVAGLPFTPGANAVIPGQNASTLADTVSGFTGPLARLYVGTIGVTGDSYVWTGCYYV